jgi:sodium transport system ATP-binding protein
MREAERLADRIVMIHKGKILADGTLEDLRNISTQTDLDDIFVFYINQYTDEMELRANEF